MIVPGAPNPLLWGGDDPLDEYGVIGHSVRCNAPDTAYLSRTFGAPTDAKRVTLSFWAKLGNLAGAPEFISCGSVVGDRFEFRADASGTLSVVIFIAGVQYGLTTSSVYRDPSAWYHIVLAMDTNLATQADRIALYINGTRLTAFSYNNNPPQYSQPYVNTAIAHYIGRYGPAASGYMDGYLAEFLIIDGQSLAPTAFGIFHPLTGQWRHRPYAGTYGANGSNLDFADGSTAAALGADSSGNGNTWTVTNISVAAGAGCDWLEDTPTNNYCTFNPLHVATHTFSNGNLQVDGSGIYAHSTHELSAHNSYFEVTFSAAGSQACWVGIGEVAGSYANSYIGLTEGGKLIAAGIDLQTGLASWAINDIISIRFDAATRTATWAKNGVDVTSYTLPAGTWVPALAGGGIPGVDSATVNFGQRAFAYAPPTGFKALCTKTLPRPVGSLANPRDHFDVLLHSGNGTAQAIAGARFQPDLVWTKARNDGAAYHHLVDRVRGLGPSLSSNTIAAEASEPTGVTAFNADGFSVGSHGGYNQSGNLYVDWLWRAGGAPVANNDGTIAAQVSANPTAGISLITYTGNGVNGATVGHGLGQAPKLVITKRRPGTTSWMVRHASLAPNNNLLLEDTAAAYLPTNGYLDGLGGSTFALVNGGTGIINVNDNTIGYLALAFAEVSGFSRIGAYTGNGSADGPFVHCGFRPRFLLIKRADGGTEPWALFDSARNPSNLVNLVISPSLVNVESTATNDVLVITSDGFKIAGIGSTVNNAGATYVFAAFAEFPFRYANAR